jgi:hypothetical protein
MTRFHGENFLLVVSCWHQTVSDFGVLQILDYHIRAAQHTQKTPSEFPHRTMLEKKSMALNTAIA